MPHRIEQLEALVCVQHERARALPRAARADELLQRRVVDDTLPVLGKRHLRGVMQAAAVQCGAEREGILAPNPRLQGLLGCPAALYIYI